MKKWFLIPFTFILLFAAIYIIIPNKIIFHQTVIVNAKHDAVFRALVDSKNWEKWWPVKNASAKDSASLKKSFVVNGNGYNVADILTNTIVVDIKSSNKLLRTELDFLAVAQDSVMLNWNASINNSYNPIKRIQIYLKARKLKQDLDLVLNSIKSFYANIDNTYGIIIEEVPVVDSTLIFTLDSSKGYPNTKFIYGLIDQLKKFSAEQGAQPSGFPMLNVYTTDSANYLVKVALPVNKKLKDKGNIKYKWMLGGGKILMCEVTGGVHKVEFAATQLEFYLKDYNRVAPAIPFMSLITDRQKEPDSSKWKTRIYYPVL